MVDERDDNSFQRLRQAAAQPNGNASQRSLSTTTTTDHAPSHLNHNVDLGRPPASPLSTTSAVQSFPSTDLFQKTKKNKRGHSVRNNFDTYWFIFLILSGLTPNDLQHPSTININSGPQMETKQNNVRTLFDPMIGEFCADTSPQVLDKFFNSRMRWRDDMNAWYPKEIQANMMVTEQPPVFTHGSSSNLNTTSGTNNTNRQAQEPTILDYDVIDAYWRQDIEREKGLAPMYPIQYSGQGCSTSANADISEQYERDLQLLREKSLFTPLTNEESFRYENLSKAHYADFYRTVPPAAAKRWQPATNASSTSGYPNVTERPMSPAKSNISTFDEDEAANFFSNLAKQSMMEESRPQQLPTYSNLTLCADQSNVLNNVSLAQQANLPGVWANDTFFMSNSTSNGIRGSAYNEVPAPQQQPEPEVADEILSGIEDQPLEISESEASAIWTTLQNSEDLSDAVQLHEFIGMEMLGEFQQDAVNVSVNRTDSPIPENILTCVERESSPSSGIGSMQSSSSSPNHNEDFGYLDMDDQQHNYRFYNKLAPKARNQRASFSTDASADSFKRPQSAFQRKQTKTRAALNEKQEGQRKRGRQSKDEQLAQEHNLPASAEEFAAMSHMEIQRYMRDPKLTTLQKSLIKKIRRRGRNKVAARKCRERRTDGTESVYGESSSDYYKNENYDPLYDF